jgi:hypothetical protein
VPQFAPQGSQPQQQSQQQRSGAPQYRSQQPTVRRQQAPQFIYPSIPQYNFLIPSAHPVRTPVQFAPQLSSQPVYQQLPSYFYPSQHYGQIQGGNNRSTNTPTGPPNNEFTPYGGVAYAEVQPIMQQQAAAPVPPPQKTATKKQGSKAITIINPITGKNIFDEDSTAPVNSNNNSNSSSSDANNVANDKTMSTVSIDRPTPGNLPNQNQISVQQPSDDAIDKEINSEPSTPVVSAMSDGPSVDITRVTPKHQVNKIKKM